MTIGQQIRQSLAVKPLSSEHGAGSFGCRFSPGMYLRLPHKLIGLSVLLLAFAAASFAQRADRATVTGVVTDPTGQSIPHAIVKVKSDDTGVVTDLTTNEAGAYSSPSLVLGTYTITVESPGFKTTVRSGIRLVGGKASGRMSRSNLGR